MNWAVFTQLSSLDVQVHWASAMAAFVLGLLIFGLAKGTRAHKALGWAYVAAMAVTAASAIFVKTFEPGDGMPLLAGYSPIHLFIPVTVFGIGGALVAIRNGRRATHARSMILTFMGALVVAGLFTFMPGRHMHSFFFAAPDEIDAAIAQGRRK